MADDDVKTTPEAPETPAAPPADSGLPPEWAGKSAADIYKAYSEAKAQADAYSRYGKPEQIDEVYNWGRSIAEKIQRGEPLTAADQRAVQQAQTQQAPAKPEAVDDFGEDFDTLAPREQAKRLAQNLRGASKKETEALINQYAQYYGQQLGAYQQRTEREKSLLFKILEAKMSNPKLDMQQALQQAAGLMASSPEQVLDMAIRQSIAPAADADNERKISEAVAKKLQEKETERQEAMFGGQGTHRRLGASLKPGAKKVVPLELEVARRLQKKGIAL